MTPIERLLAKIDIDAETGCWNFTGSRHYGYGSIWANGRLHRAHRLSYELHCEPIPDGLLVCHRCDNRACVNPDHLFLGTHSDNLADAMAKGRHVAISGSKHIQAKLTEADVIAIRSAKGITHRNLAAQFGISSSQISMIRAGKRRKSG